MMKMTNDSNNTHYVVHILTAQAALAILAYSTLEIQLDFCGVYCITALAFPPDRRGPGIAAQVCFRIGTNLYIGFINCEA